MSNSFPYLGEERDRAKARQAIAVKSLALHPCLTGVTMIYDIQRVERDKNGIPGLYTDLVTPSRRRIFNRVRELNGRKQQCRVKDMTGRTLNDREIKDLDR